MRAIVVRQPGGPEVMQVGEIADPQPREGDLIVRVRGAGVNRADLLQRLGRYPPPPGDPETIGMEIAVEVEHAAGSWKRGDRVMALLGGGGYAEKARVPAAQAIPIPARLSFEEAASIPEAFLTAWLNLTDIAGESEQVVGRFSHCRHDNNDLANVGCCQATVGYDLASGLGVPNWAVLPATLPAPG